MKRAEDSEGDGGRKGKMKQLNKGRKTRVKRY